MDSPSAANAKENMTCGQRCGYEMRELFCKPRARCFKGLAILSFIYSVGCALMLFFIPPVVNSHGYISGGSVDDNLESMVVSTIVMLVIFISLMVINGLLWMVYGKREGRRESIINGQLMDGF